MKEIYHQLDDGRLIEVRNWTGLDTNDAIMARSLSAEEKQTYLALKARSYTDKEIFNQLNPDLAQPADTPEVRIPLDQLTREQIVWCIRKIVGDELPSLSQLAMNDLIKLFLRLSEG